MRNFDWLLRSLRKSYPVVAFETDLSGDFKNLTVRISLPDGRWFARKVDIPEWTRLNDIDPIDEKEWLLFELSTMFKGWLRRALR